MGDNAGAGISRRKSPASSRMIMSSFAETDESEWTFCETELVAVDSDDVTAGRRG